MIIIKRQVIDDRQLSIFDFIGPQRQSRLSEFLEEKKEHRIIKWWKKQTIYFKHNVLKCNLRSYEHFIEKDDGKYKNSANCYNCGKFKEIYETLNIWFGSKIYKTKINRRFIKSLFSCKDCSFVKQENIYRNNVKWFIHLLKRDNKHDLLEKIQFTNTYLESDYRFEYWNYFNRTRRYY